MAWYAEGLSDALGDRLLLFDSTGPGLELLRIDSRVAGLAGFEDALRARVEALRGFTHPAFAKVRAVTWLDEPQPQLALVSEVVPGERLSNVLRTARVAGRRPDPAAVVSLLRQLLPALAALHEHADGAAHGLLAADRIIVGPGGELVITEHALGPAVDATAGDDEGLRHRLGLPAAGDAEDRARHDVAQVGRLAVSMLLGRTARGARPAEWADALDQAARIWGPALRPPLRTWLSRALALDDPFDSAREAQAALDRLLPDSPAAAPALEPPGREAPPALGMPGTGSIHTPDASGEEHTPAGRPLPRDESPTPAMPPARAVTVIPAAPRSEPHPHAPAARTHERAVPMASLCGSAVAVGEGRPRSAGERRLTRLRLAAAGLAAVALVEAAVLVGMVSGGSPGAAAPAASGTAPLGQAPGSATVAALPRARGNGAPAGAASRPGRRQATREPALLATSGRSGPAPSSPSPAPGQAAERGASLPSSVIGWVNVEAPSRVRVYANGRLLGTTRASSFRLPVGDHAIALVDETTGERTDRSVRIVAGRTIRVTVESFE